MPFQSAPPCGGRPAGARSAAPARGFNPRPRAGGDSPSRPGWHGPGVLVSIRAPVRGATPEVRGAPRLPGPVSIRAPVRGATWSQPLSARSRLFQSAPPCGGRRVRAPAAQIGPRVFQSAPPCGGRHESRARHVQTAMVSIRAPVRGATRAVAMHVAQSLLVSIRAPVRGATCRRKRRHHRRLWFQSAPPCGGRHRMSGSD